MPGDLDRLLSDAAATPTRAVDVDALHARAERTRRRERLVVGVCAVALLAVGAGAVLTVTGGGSRVELGPADAPAGTSAMSWPLRLRAEAVMHPADSRGIPVVIDLEGTGWRDWLAVAASGPPEAASVEIATADHRYGGGEDWVYTDEPYTLLKDGAEVVASAPQAAYTAEGHPWWDDTRPGPLPHPLLRPWQASAAALDEPVEVVEPAGAWAERRAEVAERLDLPDDQLSVHAWEIGPGEDCPSAQPTDCVTTVTAVVLTEADVPMLVELDGPAAGSGRLEVTHLDATARQRPPKPEPEPEIAPDATVDPVALVGLWEVLDAGEQAGTILRLDVRSLRLFRDCGAISGGWDANHDGLFVAGGGAWSSECAEAGDDPTPGWLLAAAAHRPDGDGHVLLDEDGEVVARLVPGEEPTLPPTILQSVAAPPVVTDDTRRQLAPAEPLPPGIEPADSQTLLGRWIPTDAPEDSESHAHLEPDAVWTGSDGCNGLGGRWRAGSDGSLLATGTGSTDIGCENIPVETRLTRAARAGFDGATLVLYDRQGAELGRFEPSDGAASAGGDTGEAPDDGDPPEQPTGNPELTRVLNEHLALFIEQAGFTPSGGDHDFLSGSNTVEMDGGTVVTVFIYPMERADLGDVSFEQTGTVEVGDTAVMLGHRSDGQAAARFDCGEFQFQFFDEDDSAVEEVAVALADEVFCPYDPTTPTQP